MALLFALLSAGAVLYARWIYRKVDLPVTGMHVLWPLRAAALVLLLLILFNPQIPWGRERGLQDRWVLVDASLSMASASDSSRSPWADAVRRAEALEREGWHVVTFGGSVEAPDVLSELEPTESATRLAPALIRAVESGARQIRILSDLRLEDVVAVRGVLDGLAAEVAFEVFGADRQNAGVLSLEVEDRPDVAASGVAHIEVHGGTVGDSLMIDIVEEGTVVASVAVAAPGPGLRGTVDVALPGARESGLLRFEARMTAGTADDFPQDDGAVDYATAGVAAEGGVVVISLAPDWEPRALLPVLARITGLPGSGYLRVGPGRYLPRGRAIERTAPVDSATVRRSAEGAALLVLHGLTGDADPWVQSLISRTLRMIAFATDRGGAELLGVATSPLRSGEWYLVEEPPPSPLAGVLQPLSGLDLPPLGGLLVPQDRQGLVAPAMARLRGTGPAEAPIYLRVVDERRQALILARGFWRWSARPATRDAYETLWSGVAGWLLREPALAGAEVRPARRVVPRGERVAWLVPVEREGSRVRIRSDLAGSEDAAADAVAAETPLDGSGTVFSQPLDPGPYRYAVLNTAGDSLAGGRFDVAVGTPDMLPAPADPDALLGAIGDPRSVMDRGRPLRTLPWPYLLIIALLCAEWIGRRRSGLR